MAAPLPRGGAGGGTPGVLPARGGLGGLLLPAVGALSPDVEVLAVQYPGRQDRRQEGCAQDVETLVAESLAALSHLDQDRPLALFGHSMGAVVAYETARRLGTPPAILFASGRRAPSRTRDESMHLQPDEVLAADLRTLGGTDSELLDDPDILRMVLPAVRADYRAIETYRHTAGPPLACPIRVLTGASDTRVTPEEAEAWQHHTTADCAVDTFPGGHFFLREVQDEITTLVRRELGALARA
ncbi:alpha/beta fold hydrolase [Streptomyces coeruleoprunus]